MKKYLLAIPVIALMAIGIYSFDKKEADANPSVFQVTQTAVATTTVTYMSAGTATTTITHDSLQNRFATDGAALMIQLKASSTATTLKWKYEFSQDGIDWFQDNQELTTNATTTVQVRDSKEFSWVFASSTPNNGGTGSDFGLKLVNVPTPARFTRAVFYLPVGSTKGSLLAQIVAKKQI